MRVCLTAIALLISCPLAHAQEPIHHTLQVTAEPNRSSLHVTDQITLPHDMDISHATFALHADLQIEANANVTEVESQTTYDAVPLKTYRISPSSSNRTVTIRYSGNIHHGLVEPREESERSFSETPGIVGNDGIFLASSTLWYPHFQNHTLSFSLDIRLPPGWTSVSQGARIVNENTAGTTRTVWEEKQPQDEIFLIAAPFHEYSQNAGPHTAFAFLRNPEPALAAKYLDATGQYLEMYSKLLGPYPYAKFALVENFWETGYGMPSFTLLGPQVIRFPFIIQSSYPHEILHNWWGNGVFVDYDNGNWAEGLTAYLADHLLREQQGAGAEHRRDILQKYADYVHSARDFPLQEFRNRHNSASESVGYGKALMLFHMLRLQLGDDRFIQALRTFYKKQQFKKASWSDIQKVVKEVSGKDYTPFFKQWLERHGAPELQLRNAVNTSSNGMPAVQFELAQLQSDDPFTVEVPVALFFREKTPELTTVTLTGQQQTFSLQTPNKAVQIQIDPQFDTFRRLDSREIPAALSQGFGADHVVLIIPTKAPPELRQSYEQLALAWQSTQQGEIQIARDDEFSSLPAQGAVWILGWENKWRDTFANALIATGATLNDDSAVISDSRLDRATHAVIATARNPQNPAQTWLWLGAGNPRAHAGLARKLPHYRKYSYLAFTGDEPTNTVKGQWSTLNSPLVATLSNEHALETKIPPRPPLTQLPPKFSSDRMKADILYLAHADREGRGAGSRGIDAAADYIATAFRDAGLRAGGDNDESYFQQWEETLPAPINTTRLRNVVAFLPGTNPAYKDQSVIVSAHYDHLGFGQVNAHAGDEGKLHPGADDNASGVAVMLELARAIGRTWQPERTIVFVAFSGEELGRRGSIRFAEHTPRFPLDKILAVINLDTVGRIGNAPLNILGAGSAKEWVHLFRGVGFVTGLQTNIVAHDIGSSDQATFIERGVPAVQLFATAHTDFHRPIDTADKIDWAGLVNVATIVKESIEYLAARPNKLSFNSDAPVPTEPGAGKPGQRTGIGTVPDFTYTGPGVRVSDIVGGSSAELAGLKKNDVLVKLADHDIRDIAHYAQLLREIEAGTRVSLLYLRDGKQHAVTVTVRAR